jgi:hypothetical protein
LAPLPNQSKGLRDSVALFLFARRKGISDTFRDLALRSQFVILENLTLPVATISTATRRRGIFND